MKKFLTLALLASAALCADAASVSVTMNAVSTTMSLADKTSGQTIEVGTPDAKVYTFDAPAGVYTLTAYGTDGSTVNGTIDITVTDDAKQAFTVITCTAYASNSGWVCGTDYTLDVTVCSREGELQTITIGNSVTSGRKTFLALNGNSFYASFIPSEAHAAEGYMTLYKSNTLTANINVTGAIPLGADYTVTVPANADFVLGMKFAHFTRFTTVEPLSTEVTGDSKKITYHIANGQVYNYRTWMSGGLTQGGYFTMYTDATKRPELAFTTADYQAFAPTEIKHDVQWNSGYETGDIFVNINERGHLRLNVGEQFLAHAMRTWQLTDTQTNNYFIEPDFHYTVIGLDGKPSTDVITIDNADTTTDPWSTIKAVGKGTAIVLVTYDAIGLNYYSQATKKTYMGGEYWSAIWPENTAAYVVSVGEPESSAVPNMVINEAYNTDALKDSGQNVDAEHDVFYYLDTEAGYAYTFTPTGVAKVEIAYPTIGERMATYTGFATEGVTANGDGSYTLLLKEGRQIVRLTDANGAATYQVLTAKTCHREITNATRPGSFIFQPGDNVKIQYSGLRHPANKLAGIYNMSAYVTYNGTPNGTSLILGSGQYTFGSAASAQAVTATIPEDATSLDMTEGVIQVNGYGDPIGNHRIISDIAGRSPNFTAVAHKTYFGAIPDVHIAVSERRDFNIRITANKAGATYTLTQSGIVLTPDENGVYTATFGDISLTATLAGHRCYRNTFNIPDDADGDQTFNVELVESSEFAWDGTTLTEPALEDNYYQISTGAQLAWFSNKASSDKTINGILLADIDLGDYEWSPIGGNITATAYQGTFDGNGHSVTGLYINKPSTNYQGLFAYVYNGTITNLEVSGEINAKQYAGGIAAYLNGAKVSKCANHANVTTVGNYAGGITSYTTGDTGSVTDCYNTGDVTAPAYAGGISGYLYKATYTNVYSIGTITSSASYGGCVGFIGSNSTITNAYTTFQGATTASQTLVTNEQIASGEIAYLLGESFGQHIGYDSYPVLGGMKVYYDEATDSYSNSMPTSVDGITATAEDAPVYYDLQGRRIAKPSHGVTIVVHSDGTVTKQIIR